MSVIAHDSDAGRNADVVYKLKDGYSRFTIERKMYNHISLSDEVEIPSKKYTIT